MKILIAKIAKLEKNEYVKTISLVALVLGALITIGSFSKTVGHIFYEEFFATEIMSREVSNLAAGQDIDYFRKLLGPQILQREVSPKIQEFIFHYKNAYIQTLVTKEDNNVIFWAITDCIDELVIERPAFYNYADKLVLNKSTFKNFFGQEKGDLEIFISGATANSYAYESIYLGNPSSYQTVVVGANDICTYFDADIELSGSYPEDVAGAKQKEINDFRSKNVINTYGESAPVEGDGILRMLKSGDPYLNFGVDRIRVRYFPNY